MADVARALVADRRGVVLGEIEPDWGAISWKLNGIGQAPYQLAKTDEKATEDFFRFGNLLYVEFSNGLPPWGGMIDPPRKWDERFVGATAYSAEYLLGLRMTDRGRYFDSAGVGHIFRSVIEEANGLQDMLVDVGQVWAGGGRHSPAYHFKSLLEIAQKSIGERLTPADFRLRPVESGGVIRFEATLLERGGASKPGLALVEDRNVGRARLVEQGPIWNSYTLVGEGTTWGADRLIVSGRDEESRAVYGLRENAEILGDVSQEDTLEAALAERLAQYARPHNMLELEALDTDPAGFGEYDIGDIVPVQLYRYGFEGYEAEVRILAREYVPGSGVCGLVVREV